MNAPAKLPIVAAPILAMSGIVPVLTLPNFLAHLIALVIFGVLLVIFAVLPVRRRIREVRAKLDAKMNGSKSTADRLGELDDLKRRDLVTPEEYATKRQEILKDL